MSFVRTSITSILLLSLLGGFWAVEVEATLLSAEEGGELKIKCSHSNAQGNIKYFCKKTCSGQDVLIRSESKVHNSRFSIRDTGNIFYVTITDLNRDDAGEYWCGVERVGRDTYNYVLITVTPRVAEPWLQYKTSTETLLYIGVGLAALLFILLIAIVIFLKRRHRDVSEPMAAKDQNQRDNTTLADTFKHSEPGPWTSQRLGGFVQEPTNDLYANVRTEEEESYSSVHFTKHRRDSVDTRTDPETLYSPVKT